MNQQFERTYSYQGREYRALITRKSIRNYHIRLLEGKDELRVSVPRLATLKRIDQVVGDALKSILKRNKSFEPAYENRYLYYLGEKHLIGEMTQEEVIDFLKKYGKPYLEERVRHFESLMGVKPPYDVRVRSMKTRYGVNSKGTHRITFMAELLHYSPSIIDTVVVHELAHHFEFNHSKSFYDIVFRYCPEYKRLHKLLRSRIYHE